MSRTRVLLSCLALAMLAASHSARAEESPLGPNGELREAMADFFRTRLRVALDLTDAQMAEIVPRLQRIERSREESRRRRVGTVRDLHQGLRSGVGDGELQSRLDRLEAIEDEQREIESSVMSEIDRQLTVRQRVQLRFFVQRFRSEVRRKIEELRGPAGAGRGDRPPRGRRNRRSPG